MNNIEKLYELANAFTTYTVQGGDTYKVTRFTPEKQLELIKWLVNKYRDLRIELKIGMYYLHIPQIYTGEYSVQFEEGLTGLIIFLWNDLTEQQRNEVKEILK